MKRHYLRRATMSFHHQWVRSIPSQTHPMASGSVHSFFKNMTNHQWEPYLSILYRNGQLTFFTFPPYNSVVAD